jgi:ABC-type sugar transport system ATPase subunit
MWRSTLRLSQRFHKDNRQDRVEPNATGGPASAGPPVGAGSTPALRLEGITKSYGHVQALSGVDFSAYAGEIVALVGDNGAGKSTLVKVMAGSHQPDTGQIFVNGEQVTFRHPKDALKVGIATVFQDLALVEALDVARNMFLGHEPSRFGIVNRRHLIDESVKTFESLNIKLPPVSTNIGLLSGGQRQGIAVARSVLQGGNVVLMDEPTAALGVRETARLLDIIKRLQDQGKAVVLVTHNMDMVLDISTRVHALRLGRTAGVVNTHETDHASLVSLITGGDLTGERNR